MIAAIAGLNTRHRLITPAVFWQKPPKLAFHFAQDESDTSLLAQEVSICARLDAVNIDH